MRSSHALRRRAVLVGLLGLAAGAVAFAYLGNRSDVAPAPQGAVDSTPGTAAMRASIDPETGELIQGHSPATKADNPELQNMLSRSTEGLVEEHHPDGRVHVDLQGRFQSASVATIDSSGKVQTTCVENPGAAHAYCQNKPMNSQSKQTTSPAAEDR